MNPSRKRRFVKILVPIVRNLASSDPIPEIRGRAFTVLCELGALEAIDVGLKLITNEPEDSYAKLNLAGGFGRLIENGLGVEARERFYTELRNAKVEQTKRRLRQAMETLRNAFWARPV